MLGDPRQLNDTEKQWYKKMTSWLKEMHSKYQIFKYYQTSQIFNKPGPYNWDGFARFNPEKDGGIFCVFRNDQKDHSRIFILPWCIDHHKYAIIDVLAGKEKGIFTGNQLKNEGITITIDRINQAGVFEIRPLGKKD
jgi:hypothetical protein